MKWINIAFTWNRTKNEGKFAVNGNYVKTSLLVTPDANAEIRITSRKTYRLGYPANRNGAQTFNGYIKQLMVFNRSLNIEEIKAAMGK